MFLISFGLILTSISMVNNFYFIMYVILTDGGELATVPDFFGGRYESFPQDIGGRGTSVHCRTQHAG
jgi:hypothetical protein